MQYCKINFHTASTDAIVTLKIKERQFNSLNKQEIHFMVTGHSCVIICVTINTNILYNNRITVHFGSESLAASYMLLGRSNTNVGFYTFKN